MKVKAPHTTTEIRNATSLAKARDMVRANLEASNDWLFRGLVAIFQRQTADEVQTHATRHDNDIGFNGADAAYLTWAAKNVLAWNASRNRRFPTPLNPRHTEKTRGKMLKYAGQLAGIARLTPEPAPAAPITPEFTLVESVVSGG
jgi:hypothetical protein